MKVDGWRIVAIKAEGAVRLVSRNDRDHTRRFPELVKALDRLSGTGADDQWVVPTR